MDYWFKCQNCGSEIQSNSTEDKIPKEVSCIKCFHKNKVVGHNIQLFTKDLETIDEKVKEKVEKLL